MGGLVYLNSDRIADSGGELWRRMNWNNVSIHPAIQQHPDHIRAA